jgi:hypothetical protein
LPGEVAFGQRHVAVEGPVIIESVAVDSTSQRNVVNTIENTESREYEGAAAQREDMGSTSRDQPGTASFPDEALKTTPKDRTQVSKIRIVPVFGFMSGVFGQCYLVSLSPETHDSEAEGQTEKQSSEERLRRALELLSTRHPDSLSCGRPMSGNMDASSIKKPNIQSVGLLHREGDEFFVDPLPRFSLNGEETRLNSLPTLDGKQQQSYPCCSDMQPWDGAHETKQEVDGLFPKLNEFRQSHTAVAPPVSNVEATPKLEQSEGNLAERSIAPKVLEEIDYHRSLTIVDSSKFIHGTYSWFAI